MGGDDTLRRRLRDLIDRGDVDRDGARYVATEAALPL